MTTQNQLATDELRLAAQALRELTTKVPSGHWEAGERCVWVAGTDEAIVTDALDGTGGAATPEIAEYIARMGPHVSQFLAEFFEECAAFNHYDVERPNTAEHHLARRLLGDAPEEHP